MYESSDEVSVVAETPLSDIVFAGQTHPDQGGGHSTDRRRSRTASAGAGGLGCEAYEHTHGSDATSCRVGSPVAGPHPSKIGPHVCDGEFEPLSPWVGGVRKTQPVTISYSKSYLIMVSGV